MTHIGKIGRLSKGCRNELGQRIEDGEPGTQIVDWLNGQPDVQKILAEQFGGRAITEQNLSDWKRAGHLDWLRREEAKEAAVRLVEEADDLEEATEEMSLSDRFAIVLAAEMTRLAAKLLETEADPEKRWQRLCEINRELSQLRRDDHRAVRMSIQQERWRQEQERTEDEIAAREAQEAKRRRINLALSPAFNHEVAKMFGGGEAGKGVAERLHRIRFGLCGRPVVAAGSKEEGQSAECGVRSAKWGTGKKPAKAQESGVIQPNRGEKKSERQESVKAETASECGRVNGGSGDDKNT